MLEIANSKCNQMVKDLVKFFKDKNVQKRLGTWREEDVPDLLADDFELTKFLANKKIKEKIKTEIKAWESENGCLKKAFEDFKQSFISECHILERQQSDIQFILEGNYLEKSINFEGLFFVLFNNIKASSFIVCFVIV